MRNVYRPAPFVLLSTNHGTMVVNRNDFFMVSEGAGIGVGHQLLNTQSFDQPEIDFVLDVLDRRHHSYGHGVVAIDCGANIGVHTVEWARSMHSWGSVLAFEAQEKIFYALAGNVIINNCLNVTVKHCAVGLECSTINVPIPNYFVPSSFGSLELVENKNNEFIGQRIDYTKTQEVELISIDSLDVGRLDFLKIDVEGMEADVLAGGEITIRRCRPVIFCEVIKSDREVIFGFLSDCGYRWRVIGNNLIAAHMDDESLNGLVEFGSGSNSVYTSKSLAGDSATPVRLPEHVPLADIEVRWTRDEECESDIAIGAIIRDVEPTVSGGLDEQWVAPAFVQHISGTSLESVNAAIGSCSADWVVLLHAGDIWDSSLVAALRRNISRYSELSFIYFDESQVDDCGKPVNHHYKPDFNIDYLRSMPYCGASFAVRKDVFTSLGGFNPHFEGVAEYDLLLRVYESLGAAAIGHVSGALVCRKSGVSFTKRPLSEVLEFGRHALVEHLKRLGVSADVVHGVLPATYRVQYRHAEQPLVSIIIPTRNQRAMLERCLESLFSHTLWPNYEILIVDNGSDEVDALQYLDGLRTLERDLDGRLRVLNYPHSFNYSAMNNMAAGHARGEYLLLLNNDTAALHDDWLDVMMSHALRPEVGIVGAKLLYPDGKVQHAGVVLGVKGPAEHPFIGRDAKDPGYYARLQVDQNYSAVTGACLLVRKSLFDKVGGLDADELAVSYSDIDLCLKIRELDKLVVWTPHALLLHEGSKSQKAGVESTDDQAKAKRFEREQAVMYRRWMPQIANDPAYNRCLSLVSTDFIEESDLALRWDPEWRPAPRIIAQSADRMGCGEYRIIAPARALINAGRVQGHEIDRIYTPPELAKIKPDALVLQRQVEPHQIEAIERHKRFNDVFCVFEIDDLVTNVPVKNAHKKHLPKDLYKRLRRAVGVCDRLVVATDELAEAYSGLNSDVKVIPNFIEDARWGGLQAERRVGRKPRVGWAGGISHTGDLDLIAGVVDALKDEVEWVFFGMCPERVRPYVHEFHEPVSIDQYASRLASLNLDLAVAPLEDVPFNHAKSHLRLLEYGILGYPVVCSDLTPYRGDYPVTRVRNRHREWVEAIRAHVSDLDATANQGDVLRKYVREHWLLENNLDAWLEGWLPKV